MAEVVTMLDLPGLWGLAFFTVAMLYSAVGHGGASGYLAVMAIMGVPPVPMATAALGMNMLVATTSGLTGVKQQVFSWRLLWPFLVASVPMAWLGASYPLAKPLFECLLGGVLIVAAIRFFWQPAERTPLRPVSFPMALGCGAVLGWVSGVIGIGGGVFLSPLLLLAGWADTRATAAASAWFIVVNSCVGLAARAVSAQIDLAMLWPWVLWTLAGGIIGSRMGFTWIATRQLQYLLALVMLSAGLKVLLG